MFDPLTLAWFVAAATSSTPALRRPQTTDGDPLVAGGMSGFPSVARPVVSPTRGGLAAHAAPGRSAASATPPLNDDRKAQR